MDRSKWEYKKLGDIALISAGQGAPQGENNYSPEGTPFVKAGNIESLINGLSEYDIQKVNDAVVKSHRLKLYKAGSVLFAKSGMSCMKGLVYTLKNDCYVVSHLAIVTPKDINSHYLNYYFQVHKPNSLIKDSAYPSISLKDIENLIILCPSQTDQQRIVAELDCLNKMIAVKQEQLKEFDKLAQSIFYDMFGDPVSNEKGWKQCLLKDVSETITDGDHMPPPKSDSGVPFVTISNVNKDTRQIDFSSTFFVPREYYDNIPESKKPRIGDVLYTVTGSYGIPIIIREEKEFCFQRHIGLIRPNKEIEPLFLCMWAGCQSVKKYADRYATGVAQKTVSLKVLRNFPMIVPPLSLQQQFAEKISAIEAQKELVKQSIAETQALLDYSMDYYFNE